jgi:hypothetical protein
MERRAARWLMLIFVVPIFLFEPSYLVILVCCSEIQCPFFLPKDGLAANSTGRNLCWQEKEVEEKETNGRIRRLRKLRFGRFARHGIDVARW